MSLLESLVFPAVFYAENNPQEYLRILLLITLVIRSFLRIQISQDYPQVKFNLLRIFCGTIDGYDFNVSLGNSAGIVADFTAVFNMAFPVDFSAVWLFCFFPYFYWILNFLILDIKCGPYNFRFKSRSTHIQIKCQIVSVDCN